MEAASRVQAPPTVSGFFMRGQGTVQVVLLMATAFNMTISENDKQIEIGMILGPALRNAAKPPYY